MSAFDKHVEALGVRGHQAVLDAVVHHLDEVAGAARAAVQPALLGRRRVAGAARRAFDRAPTPGASVVEDRRHLGRRPSVGPADHQAVATLEPEHAAAGADVEVVDARGLRAAPARSTSSRYHELPPSMIVSPGESSGANASIVSPTKAAGTMIHTWRGAASASTTSCGRACAACAVGLRAPALLPG